MAPVSKQKQSQTTGSGGGRSKPCRWWLYISIVLVLVLAITVVSSYVLKMDQHHQDQQGASTAAHVPAASAALLAPSESAHQDQLLDELPPPADSPAAGFTMNNGNSNSNNHNNNNSRQIIRTQVPVIGVLSQVLRDYKRFTKEHHLHIAASYVKWLEAAGAQVVPILLNQNDVYYEQMFKQTNGLLLPGGDNLLDPAKATPMMVAARKLYGLAVEANEAGHHYPIWGTCLGLELLSVLSSGKNTLDSCLAEDESLPMSFVARGKLFAPAPYANLPELGDGDFARVIVDILGARKLTYNFHRKCLTDAGLQRAGLGDFYRPLAYSQDANNNKFIAIFEAVRYPFFGVQFHPEKPPFEFVVKEHQLNVPHSRQAIAVSRYFADFFVQQAQLSDHQADRALLAKHLIYAHAPMYTAPLRDMYEQRYLFPFGSDLGASTTEEFIEHLVAEDEQVPEDVGGASTSAAAVVALASLPNASEGLPQRDFYILSNATASAAATVAPLHASRTSVKSAADAPPSAT